MKKYNMIDAHELRELLAKEGVEPSHSNFWRFLKVRGINENEIVKIGTSKYIARDRVPFILSVAKQPPVRDAPVAHNPKPIPWGDKPRGRIYDTIEDAIKAARPDKAARLGLGDG